MSLRDATIFCRCVKDVGKDKGLREIRVLIAKRDTTGWEFLMNLHPGELVKISSSLILP